MRHRCDSNANCIQSAQQWLAVPAASSSMHRLHAGNGGQLRVIHECRARVFKFADVPLIAHFSNANFRLSPAPLQSCFHFSVARS